MVNTTTATQPTVSESVGSKVDPVAESSKPSSLKMTARRSRARGHASHGWLKSYHTFSFASYQDSKFDSFGALRVINEDRVAAGTGFGQHSHAEFEIFSYIVSGELEHKDSMGNLEIMKPGEVQMTSTGTGISHSEYNRNNKEEVHFLQIWALPNRSRLAPKYYNRVFTPEEKRDTLVKVVGQANQPGVTDKRNGKGPAPVHANLAMYASILSPGCTITHTLSSGSSKAYLHLIMKSGYRSPDISAAEKYVDGGAKLWLNKGLTLEEGDGAFFEALTGAKAKGVEGEKIIEIKNTGPKDAEFVLFEIA